MIFNYVIKEYDNTIVCGHRSPEEQFELFKKGRKHISGEWVVTEPDKVLTYKDGYTRKSKHNTSPSLAVDAAPYDPILQRVNWDPQHMIHFAGYVLGVTQMLKSYGAIEHSLRWGGDWNADRNLDNETFVDMPHFELV